MADVEREERIDAGEDDREEDEDEDEVEESSFALRFSIVDNGFEVLAGVAAGATTNAAESLAALDDTSTNFSSLVPCGETASVGRLDEDLADPN